MRAVTAPGFAAATVERNARGFVDKAERDLFGEPSRRRNGGCMKPDVICLMASSVDGRTLPSRWRPKSSGDLFEQVHEQLGGDAWLIGRVTGQEFAKGTAYPATTTERFPRDNWIIRRDAKAYGIVLDGSGKICWGRADIGGDPIVVVLTEAVSDAHLAGLRGEGVSYIFAGKTQIDLVLVLDIVARELGVKRLLLEGGGGAMAPFCAPAWSTSSTWFCVPPWTAPRARRACSTRPRARPASGRRLQR
ncbi:hypothetical protein SSBR45G_67380 [Bradyrhizobium sp. SSBR45G]|nr:hypothetical protein SSBR45G_67380 [Bradyrhizobium sp. SSBR45G]GLH89308.1 hypothetical protein SSBR45R_67690 [Bradyrhizobium sp. SSBR45R]